MKEQSTTKGFAILSAAGMIVKLISLLYMPLLIVIIGDDAYGVYSIAYAVFLFIYAVTNSGIPVAISKLVSELIATNNPRDAVRSFKIARGVLLIIGMIMAILTFVFAVPLANIAETPRAALAIKALSPTILLTAVLSSYRGYFQGRGNMIPTAVSQIIEQITNTIFSLLFAAVFIKYSIPAGVAGGTVGTTLGAAIALVLLIYFYEKKKSWSIEHQQKDTYNGHHSNKYILRKIISYSIPITLCVGFQNAGALIDASNVKGRLLHAGFNEQAASVLYGGLGKFNILNNVPITIISALAAAVLPAIAGAAAIKDKRQIQSKIRYAFRLCFLISVPASVGLAVISEPIYKMLFPTTEGYKLMAYGSMVIILMAVVQIQTAILQSVGKLYTATVYLILGIIAKIITNYILVGKPSINITGAVFGSYVCFIIPLILNDRLIKRRLKIKYSLLGYAIRPIIAAVFMGLIVYIAYFDFVFVLSYINKGYMANLISTGLSIILGGYTYLYGLILTGGITNNDLKTMPTKVTKLIPKNMLKRIK